MKNIKQGHTESFLRMRAKEIKFINSTPFYGSPLAEKLFKLLKSQCNILQVSVCGSIVSIVSYQQDSIKALEYLNTMFPQSIVKQKTSELTQLVTTYKIN